MECEFTVELGPDDPTLAVPWRSPDGSIAYVDLRANPEAIESLSEVRDFSELAEFLRAWNNEMFQTAKCDAWFDTLMDIDDEPYDSVIKCASYVDVFFAGANQLASFEEHEKIARQFVQRVRGAEDIEARAELVIRRAFYENGEGFYWTIYATGYGADPLTSRSNWSKLLKIMQD